MTVQLNAPPVLSTPETHIFEADPTPPALVSRETRKLSDEELYRIYEVFRTAKEVKDGGYKRIALQFPDRMLCDAPRVYEALQNELNQLAAAQETKSVDNTVEKTENLHHSQTAEEDDVNTSLQELDIAKQEWEKRHPKSEILPATIGSKQQQIEKEKLFILADTSYGACCVDEIAAEHVNADVVVHYGRACLSPTARLPVIYVFTTQPLDYEHVVQSFEVTFPDKEVAKVILMADITYTDHVQSLGERVRQLGYNNVFVPEVLRDPESWLPNRTVPPEVTHEKEALREYSLFHISDPPPALLLTLSSRLKDMYIYPTTSSNPTSTKETSRTREPPKALLAETTTRVLRRRYALLTSLTTCSIFGILVNTLSVKNYLSSISTIQSLISRAGKKSYTFVVGKVNAAKVANFAEIGGWVVVGCWESSLLDGGGDFYKPVITPFELSLALQKDDERLWTGEWRGDFEMLERGLVNGGDGGLVENGNTINNVHQDTVGAEEDHHLNNDDIDDEDESEPPEYDLRTGRYISHTRPMQRKKPQPANSTPSSLSTSESSSRTLSRRNPGTIASINGTASPGAEYLNQNRTWRGLGSDFANEDEESSGNRGTIVEIGRSGVARGYVVGERGGEERR